MLNIVDSLLPNSTFFAHLMSYIDSNSHDHDNVFSVFVISCSAFFQNIVCEYLSCSMIKHHNCITRNVVFYISVQKKLQNVTSMIDESMSECLNEPKNSVVVLL